MQNPFQSILDTVSGAFSKKNESVIGIDIGSAFLKVVQLKKRAGKAVLETYGELALGPYAGMSVGQATNLSAEKMAEAIKDLFRESHVTGGKAALSIPLGSSLLSLMEMPNLNDAQLARMIPIEARKYIPVPISEVTIDWWVVPHPEQGPEKKKDEGNHQSKDKDKIEVLIVAIHNDVIQKYKTIAGIVPLENPVYELEVFSTARSTFGNHGGSVMVIDFGAATTKMVIVEYGTVRSQYIVNRGSQDITQSIAQSLGISIERAEDLKRASGIVGTSGEAKQASDSALLTLEHIFSEANRVVLNYEHKYGKTIKSIVLTGGGALLQGLHNFSKQRMETDVIFADPFAKVEAPAFLSPTLRDAGPEFSVSIGLALRTLEELP